MVINRSLRNRESELNKPTSVVHITPHLGGGVGTSLTNFIHQSETLNISNKVFSLDWCAGLKENLRKRGSISDGIFWQTKAKLTAEIISCDCVLIHYWNHPLLTVFLSEFRLPRDKSIFWCHNSGISEPHIIPSYLLEITSKIVFTSQSSVSSPIFKQLSRDIGGPQLIVPTVRNLQEFIGIGAARTRKHSDFKLLYVGAVTKSKMHPDASVIFAELSKRGCQIQIVGGPDQDQLANEVKSRGGNIEVFGQVDNVQDFYQSADIFVYPLRNDHYGTGEQVILEALASGMPVVAFNNAAEAAILNQIPDIRLAGSTTEFIEIVINMIRSSEELFEKSKEISQKAALLFGSNRMTSNLLEIINDLANSKRNEMYVTTTKNKPSNLLALYARASFFDEAVYRNVMNDPDRGLDIVIAAIRKGIMIPDQIEKWKALTKSSPAHYRSYFPEDREIELLVKEIDVLTN